LSGFVIDFERSNIQKPNALAYSKYAKKCYFKIRAFNAAISGQCSWLILILLTTTISGGGIIFLYFKLND
jgi:hypothetical protein